MNLKQSKGITLISLVITIILLLILAGISIQAITNTGIFEKASQAKKEAERSQIIEWLNLKLIEEQTYKPFGTSEEIIEATRQNVENNKSELGKTVTVEDTKTEEDGEQVDIYFYVQVDKDVYKVDIKGAQFIGEAGNFPPVIKLESIKGTTNSITVQVTTKRNEGGKIEYYIKAEDEKGYGQPVTKTETETTYTYTGLEQNKTYNIKIVAVAENEQIAEVKLDKTLGSVTELTESNTTFTYSPVQETWTNGSVTATVSTTVTGYTLQTSKDGKNWSNETSQTFTENGTVYARLWDGINEGKALSGNVTNIDTVAPKAFTPTATSTTNSLTVTASAEDGDATSTNGKSGIAGYRFKLDSGNWTNYQTSGTYTWNNLTQTTDHTITVEAKDNTGNTTTGTVTKGTGTIEQPVTATCSPTTWTSGSVTVTLPTKTGFTTIYTIDGTIPTTSSTQYSASFTVSSNCIIKFAYSDGTNIGTVQTANVTNIDTTAPSSFTISKSAAGVNSFTLSATFEDNESGLGKIIWYYKRPQDSSWQNTTDIYTGLNSSTAGTTGSTTKTKEITGLTIGGTVQAYAVGYDVAGNSITTTNADENNPLTFNTEAYTISYNANGGSGAPSNQTKYYGVNITLSSTKPTKSGYTFLGWSESSTATSANYAAGATYSGNSNATLYAVWTQSDYSAPNITRNTVNTVTSRRSDIRIYS